MKKLLCLLLPILFLMSGCNATKHQLIKEDGNYYITYDSTATQEQSSECYGRYTITYDSITQMKDAIIKADFTKEQLREFSYRIPQVDGKLKIINIDKLYEATCPPTLTAKLSLFLDTMYATRSRVYYIIHMYITAQGTVCTVSHLIKQVVVL